MELIIISAIVFLFILFFYIKIVRNKIRRKESDKTTSEHYKLKVRPPTWRFQKFHPINCPHQTGIYRKVDYKIMNDTIKKTVFVCADCISVVEIDEIDFIDKFKKTIK